MGSEECMRKVAGVYNARGQVDYVRVDERRVTEIQAIQYDS